MKKIYYFLFAILLIGGSKTFAYQLYQLTPECEAYIDQDRYVIHFTLPDYSIDIDDNDNDGFSGDDDNCGKFSVIDMKFDYDATDIPGYPVLPFYSLNLLLPEHFSNLNYSYHILQTETIHVEPRITPAFKGGSYESDFIDEHYVDYDNGDCYNTYYYQYGYDSIFTHGFYMDYFNIDTVYNIFGTNGLTFTIHPFSYHPETGFVNVLKEAEIEIYFTGDDLQTIVQSYTTMDNVTEKVVAAHYDTFNDITLTDMSQDNGNYLIIAANHDMSFSLQPYITYKTNQHYHVEVLFLDYYGAVGNISAISYLIRHNGIMNNPDYVLLVGSLDQIPPFGTSSENNPYSDNGYLHPLIGRWIVRGNYGVYNDINNIVSKTISSEIGYANINSHAALFSGIDDRKRISKRFYRRMQKIGERICVPYSLYDGRSSIVDFYTMKSALQSIPLNFFVYGGHGMKLHNNNNVYITSGICGPYWVLPSYYLTTTYYNISDFNNASPYPLGFGFACHLNSYAYMDNFGARWCAESTGGVCFYGSTIASYTTSNNYLSKRMFAKMTNITNKLDNFPLSLWIACAEYDYLFALPSSARVNQYLKYNLIGDPTIHVYGMDNYGTPEPFHMLHSLCDGNKNGTKVLLRTDIFDVNGILLCSLYPNKDNMNDLPTATGVYISVSIFNDGTTETNKVIVH